ncbi:hypothetical protein SKAU_G00034350, partial [Synaphobranchus kaupii]
MHGVHLRRSFVPWSLYHRTHPWIQGQSPSCASSRQVHYIASRSSWFGKASELYKCLSAQTNKAMN